MTVKKKRVSAKAAYRQYLGEKISRSMAPVEWADFDKNKGVVDNMTGWILKDTLRFTKSVLDVLEEEKLI